MFKIQNSILFLLLTINYSFFVYPKNKTINIKSNVIVGANQISKYENIIKNKRVGIVANHTSVIFKKNSSHTHLIDSLIKLDFDIKKIFAPEHGFRGTEPNGANINDEIDIKTGLKIISLHGKNRKYGEIEDKDLDDIDVLIFDIQDVGVRFYTHISTLHYVMEASARNDIPLIVLDRPNPNAHYVDGPVLDLENKSFVGMHEVPIVYGLTIGEYAQMINNEGWLENEMKSNLIVIKLENYDRNKEYDLPIIPSPNLPNRKSVNLYPSLCLFEGTNVSVGRGTNLQFQIYGSPFLDKNKNIYEFTPVKNNGSKYPKHENILCYGKIISESKRLDKFDISFLLTAYRDTSNKQDFFTKYFIKLSGTADLKDQIVRGLNEDEIIQSWQEKLNIYKTMRLKYLIYN
tara:strand:- start:2284 stop:3492 length:1209 start_codon:yes stop_codon:yes gene_type:complete